MQKQILMRMLLHKGLEVSFTTERLSVMVIDGSCAFFIALYFALISMYLLSKSIFGYLIRIVRKMGALSTV